MSLPFVALDSHNEMLFTSALHVARARAELYSVGWILIVIFLHGGTVMSKNPVCTHCGYELDDEETWCEFK